jgi:hypothetical protein
MGPRPHPAAHHPAARDFRHRSQRPRIVVGGVGHRAIHDINAHLSVIRRDLLLGVGTRHQFVDEKRALRFRQSQVSGAFGHDALPAAFLELEHLARPQGGQFSRVVCRIAKNRRAHRADFGQRVGALRALLYRGQRGQRQTGEDGHDGQGHEEFDDGESAGHPGTFHADLPLAKRQAGGTARGSPAESGRREGRRHGPGVPL